MNKYFGSGQALQIIRDTLANADTVRIATAFFEPSGFQLLAQSLSGKKVMLLIGREYGVSGGIDNILQHFMSGLLQGSLESRIEAMELLRNSLASGMLSARLGSNAEATTFDARHLQHHAKLYMADSDACVVSSSNMTWTGLLQAREAGYVIRQTEDVAWFVQRFDEYYQQGVSLTEELLAMLEEWLQLYSPRDIYLRSLLNIYGLPEQKANARLPELAVYQIPVVARLLQIEKDKRGAMLVASTGLGKTVMAAHLAANLYRDGLIDNVLLFCPAGLRDMWDRMLAGLRIRYKEYSYHALSADDWKKNRQVRELEYELHHADAKTLLVVDESHHLRNEDENKNRLKLRNQRIIRAVNGGSYVLLMTATPYSRGVEDINAQLRILPAVSEKSLFGSGHWEVSRPGDLAELSASVVLTAPTVVRNFSEIDEAGERYVVFSGNNRRYFPRKMSIHSVSYANQADEILLQLFEKNLLALQSDSDKKTGLFGQMHNSGKRDPLQEARFVHQFCSSVAEANLVLDKMSMKNGQGFEKIRFLRQAELSREIGLLRETYLSAVDDKLQKLLEIINRHQGEKILIFCVYQATARYLANELKLLAYNCETTLDTDPDRLGLVLRRFAPVANEVLSNEPGYEETMKTQIDILVATGSLAEGFNLQDACVLVNYDLPWTVLVLAQRMGRILRPWAVPRSIHIYNLIPDTMQKEKFLHAIRWKQRLSSRNQDLKSFSELPVLHDSSGSEDVEMISLARNLGNMTEADLSLNDVLDFIEKTDHLTTSSFLQDLSLVSSEQARSIRKIPAGFRAVHQFGSDGIYILFRFRNSYYPCIFDMNGAITHHSEQADKIMMLIRSESDTPPVPPLSADTRRKYAVLIEHSRTIWALEREIEPEQAEIDCCMILVAEQSL